MKELQIGIKNLKNNKASGIDNRKYGKREYVMNNYCIFVTESIISNLPIYRDKICVIPLPKKISLRLSTNYTGISLTPTAAKMNSKLLLHRIRPVLEICFVIIKMVSEKRD